jgi:pimeloyl-ACP methyl ester carboxylesterase
MRFKDKVRAGLAAGLALLLLGLSTGISSAQVASAPKAREHVYLMRGAFNVFSLGLDELGAKLQRLGINVSVENYLAWSRIVDEAAAEYKSGRVQNIILVGHSSGATAVTAVAARLGELGVPVKLAVGLDPTTRVFAAGHVDRYVNFYAPGGMGTVVDKGQDFHGVLQNVSITTAGHFDIDKNQALQDKVIAEIRAAASGRPARVATAPATRAAAPGTRAAAVDTSANHAFGQDRR